MGGASRKIAALKIQKVETNVKLRFRYTIGVTAHQYATAHRFFLQYNHTINYIQR